MGCGVFFFFGNKKAAPRSALRRMQGAAQERGQLVQVPGEGRTQISFFRVSAMM